MTYRERVKRIALVVALGLAPLLLAGSPSSASTTAPVSSALQPYQSQTLAWRTCAAGECATLRVPLDYADLSKGDIGIAVSRVRHSGPTSQGSLVVNPGGPGASGLDFAAYIARDVAPSVAREFDIIGFDPRGVQHSAPVTCMTSQQTADWLSMDATPDTPKEVAAVMAAAARISNGCLQRSPRIAPWVGTPSAAQDLDLLRSALGEQQLNWLGFSYGTALGTAYLAAFPDRVGRFVLDGALDPSLDGMQLSRGQARGFERAFLNYVSSCTMQRSCPLGRTPASVVARVNRLLAQVDAKPLHTRQGPPLTQSLALGGMLTPMYSTDLWDALTDALVAAFRGDGTGLLELAWEGSQQTGPTTFTSNMQSAYYAIDCWDLPATPAAAGMAAAARTWSKGTAIPEIAKSLAWGNAPCSTWFAHDPVPPAPVQSSTKAPILVVGTRYDPATPYAWAQALSRQLPTSTLLTFEGNGHTAYGSGSRCADTAISKYLLTGTLPAPGTRCSV